MATKPTPTDIQLLAILERLEWAAGYSQRCALCHLTKPEHSRHCKLAKALAGLRERVERKRANDRLFAEAMERRRAAGLPTGF